MGTAKCVAKVIKWRMVLNSCLVICFLFCSCATDKETTTSAITENSDQSVISEPNEIYSTLDGEDNLSIASDAYVSYETSVLEITTESTAKIKTEVTTHETTHYIKQVKIVDGVLPDGEYMLNVRNPDDDYKGAMFNVRGIWSMTEDEYISLETGDTVFLGDDAYTYKHMGVLSRETEWGEEYWVVEKQDNGLFYLKDGYEDWIYGTYLISEKYHMFLNSDVTIYGDGVSYDSLNGLWKDTLDDRDFRARRGYHYYAENGQELEYTEDIEIISVGALSTIENAQVVSMWLNPEEHESWMTPELYEQKYGSLKDKAGCIFSYSSESVLSDSDIAMLSNEGIRMAINELWARHGYIFRNEEILAYYRQFDWYVESVSADEWDRNGQNYYLNSVEKKNIEKIVKERDKRR